MMLWGNPGPGWESVKLGGKTLGNRETISRCGELVKLGTSVEKLIEYRVQSWKFCVRTVKGKRYITIRRKGEGKSLGR